MVHTKIYVIECETPFFWYVGSTFRELYARIDEHEANYGCNSGTGSAEWRCGQTCPATRARCSRTS